MTTTANELQATAQAIVAPGKGILAADESSPTIAKRFKSIDVESTEDKRREYREMLFTTPGASAFISGVILFDETIRQAASTGKRLAEVLEQDGVIPGIKVDKGAKLLAGSCDETVTEGLDGLRERLTEYKGLGARFAKWRAVIRVSDALPSTYCMDANAHALARYAALCQEQGIVPIVEPEVLMDGAHTIERCEAVTTETLQRVFRELQRQRVSLESMLLKPNMIVSGSECPVQASVAEVAAATVRCFRRTVPAAVPGIVFLSGGQSDEKATAHLSAMNALGAHPWELSFSYGRALQAATLKAWGGRDDRIESGKQAFLHRAKMNSEARYGRYTSAMEAAAPTASGDKLVSQD
ncbi:MAG: fructose-bisphosphate aldolase class I [Planctomycetota bacterium]|nr:MAG: fructose-bisphosphate aldolase class I [Planctomycetota bacterium]